MPKPWLDSSKYREVRLRESLYEAELAERLLEQGLVGNAAGRAFQARKALVAAYAAGRMEELRRAFPGERKLRGRRERADEDLRISAIMPATFLKQVAQILGGGIDVYTDKALWIHEYRYNGPDKQGVLSPYPDDEAARDIKNLAEKAKELAAKFAKASP